MQLNIIQLKTIVNNALDLLTDNEVITIYNDDIYSTLDSLSKEIVVDRIEEIFKKYFF